MLQINDFLFKSIYVGVKESRFWNTDGRDFMILIKPFLIFVKSLLFFLFDSLALSNVQSFSNNQLKLILIIRQDAIGDFVMWLDTAKEYRKLYPPEKYELVLIGNALWCGLAKQLPYWDKVIPVNVKQFKSFSRYRWKLLRKIRKLKIETAIQPTFSREFYHGDSLVRACRALRKVSSDGDMSNRNWLKKILSDRWHTDLISASPDSMTELDRNAEFFSGFSRSPYFASFPRIKIPEFLIKSELKDQTFYVLVPGTSGSVVGKEWPPSSFSNIASKVYKQTGWNGIICGVKNEYSLGEQIKEQCDAPLQNLSGQTSLPELAGLLSKSQLTISNDTGAIFISSAVGTNSVCILGGGHFGRFLPYPDINGQENNIEVAFHEMPCYGCSWKCIYKIKKGEPTPCISNIRVEEVWNKIKPLLN